ncbi:hypothetical protein SEA_DIANE_60 [Streptomyces phage Diane]|uniref:Uncharacterized protein n=1 Tax=Streptomyces phage Diane TaxID=2041207 RepID=A0A291LIH3_9CAUD|nr:hypothetical protein KGG78_gp60 [Streptomyces phage Diane]ATI18844.1 hypothetical protein SEA_DIANE_60 [Streptomyces phage Diane]
MSYQTNPELGEQIGYAVGETVAMATDEWEDAVASKGDQGEIVRFGEDRSDIFAYVQFPGAEVGIPFPLLPHEFEKVQAGK